MNEPTDQQLLRDYALQSQETAFAELVRRHIDLVYSAALRMVRDAHLAEDVTQGVFLALAGNAGTLAGHPVLSGWLHCTARNIAAKAVRSDVRRRVREQEAALMNELLATEPDASWEAIAPDLDAALGELNEADRDALLLRYFERKSATEMAGLLGISDEAAQKRVSRAVDRLRERFVQRGVTVGAGGLLVVISANAVQSAPAGLALTISAAAQAGTVISTSTLIAATKTIAMTTLQKLIIGAALTAAIGSAVYETHQAAQMREQNEALRQQQAPLSEDLTRLRLDNERLSNLVAQTHDQKALTQAEADELLKLRAQTGQARTAVQQFEKLKSSNALARQSETMPSFLTNAMMQGIKMAQNFRKKDAAAKLARMATQLQLTEAQTEGISNIMIQGIEASTQRAFNGMLHSQTPDPDLAPPAPADSEESQIKAWLTPDQLAEYPAYQQAETATAADNSAKSEVTLLNGEADLTQEQQDKAHAALYQYELNQSGSVNKDAIAQARASGNYADVAQLQIQTAQQQLADKLSLLGDILTPEQLATYKQKQLEMLDVQANAMKMFLPPATNAAAQ